MTYCLFDVDNALSMRLRVRLEKLVDSFHNIVQPHDASSSTLLFMEVL